MSADPVLPEHPTPALDEWERLAPAPGLAEYLSPDGTYRLAVAPDGAYRIRLSEPETGEELAAERVAGGHVAAALADHFAGHAHRYATDWGGATADVEL
ncbi:MAG: hypothetical protein ABEI39_05355 [Halobacteriales archaeon]